MKFLNLLVDPSAVSAANLPLRNEKPPSNPANPMKPNAIVSKLVDEWSVTKKVSTKYLNNKYVDVFALAEIPRLTTEPKYFQ